MLFRHFASLLCSGVLAASALQTVPADIYESSLATQDLGNPQQVPFGGGHHGELQEVLDTENEPDSLLRTAEEKTIYQILNDNDKFSRLVKIINISEEIVNLLNDTSAGITFFAPPNKALQPPHRHRHHPSPISTVSLDNDAAVLSLFSSYDLPNLVTEIDGIEGALDEDPDRERRKKFIRILVRAILAYHILPQGIDAAQLVQNTTFATNLTIPDDALDKEALRVRVSSSKLIPSVRINFFSSVIKSDIRGKNGIIHIINHPLFPPPSIFQELFLAPKSFGTLTSALQRVGLTDALEWRYVPSAEDLTKKWAVQGTGSSTFFAPSNSAFKKLPYKLKLFLFSPFGERVLKKLLEYHVVPGFILHTDYIHNVTSKADISAEAWTEDSSALESFSSAENPMFNSEHYEHKIFDGPYHMCAKPHHGGWKQGHCARHDHPNMPHEPSHTSPHDDDKHQWPPRPTLGRDPCGPGRSPPPPPPFPGRGPRGPACRPLPPPRCFPDHPPPPPPHGHPHHSPNPPSRGPSGPHDGDHHPMKGDHSQYPHFYKHFPHPAPIFAANLTLPTLLTNSSLHIHSVKFKYRLPIPGKDDIFVSKLFVNRQSVVVSDVVARNGAVHIINKVLNPRPPHHHPGKPKDNEVSEEIMDHNGNDWEDWEDWLLQWAEQN